MTTLWSTVQVVVVSFGLLLATCAADSVPIGCYRFDKSLELQAVAGSGKCSQSAIDKKLPVWGQMDDKCYGTSLVPLPSLKAAGKGDCGSGYISLFYWMEYEDAADRWSCTAEALPFTPQYWHGLDTVEIAGNVASFSILGEKTVAKIHSKRLTAYGIYSAKISMPGEEGGVGAMYTTTYNQLSKVEPTEWDEVDYELVNSCGVNGCKPVSGWANTFKSGTNTWEGKTWGKVMWTDPTTVSKETLMTFSWHPNNIFWYKSGKFIYEESSEDHPLPWRPSYTVFVYWRNIDAQCKWFGGCGNKATPLTMTVSDIRQLTCAEK